MAKTFVTDPQQGTRVPFLRGILTRSLQDAGLRFDEAYELASSIRQDLGEVEHITTDQLRDRVLQVLHKQYGAQVVKRYQTPNHPVVPILVRDPDGQVAPFSRAKHQRCLQFCGLPNEKAAALTDKIYRHLLEKGVGEIDSQHLGHLTYRILHQEQGAEVAERYLMWTHFRHSGRPLILLIGGTSGCGKSTIATDLANRLEIVRTQSTDMLREVMRMMIPQRLLPVLHVSSFSAWQTLPEPAHAADPDALLADGFRTQAELLSVPCEAVIQRSLRERVSLILEGVHVQPALLDRIPDGTEAVVVPIMLAVLKPEALRLRIRGRGTHAPQRRSERYLENFDGIWRLQSYLLSEADRAGMTIIPNDDKEKVVSQVIRLIINQLKPGFSATPREVFRAAPST